MNYQIYVSVYEGKKSYLPAKNSWGLGGDVVGEINMAAF